MTFHTQRRVEFRDTDAAGIVHFSAFFPMMEAAEHKMFRSLGLSVMPKADANEGDASLQVTWPRVAASCNYRAAARFEDVLDIGVDVIKVGRSSVTYRFVFTREQTPIADGEMTSVCCCLVSHGSGRGLKKVDIPEAIREKLREVSR